MLDRKTFRPEDRFQAGPFEATTALAKEVWRHRSQVRTAFMRDFVSGYNGALLGVIWNFILPLVPICFYVILAVTRIVPNFEQVAGTVAIALNATIWFLLVGCVHIPINVTHARNSEAMRTSIPLSVNIIAGFGRLMFETLVRFALIVVLMILTGSVPSLFGVAALPVLFFSIVFFIGIGLFLAIFNISAPDIKKVSDTFLNYGIFFSGVIFPISMSGPLAILNQINPFAVYIGSVRHLLFEGGVPDWTVLMVWSGAGVVVFIFGARLFFIMEKRIRGVV